MARTEIEVIKLKEFDSCSDNVLNTAMFAALDATDGGEFVFDGADHKTLILLQNTVTAVKTVTVKAGNGIQGVNDLEIEIDASSTKAVALNSGAFKNMYGDDKGKVIMTGPSDIKIAVLKLP